MIYYFHIQIFLLVFDSIESNSLETMEISSIMINFMSESFSRSLTFCLSLKGTSFEPIPIPKAVFIVVPPLLIVATPVGASSKILGLSGSLLFYNKSLLRTIWIVLIKCDLPTLAPPDIDM